MISHIFVDETKHRDYLMVAAVVLPADLQPVRQLVRSLVLPGQRRVHMKKESAPRKRLIADTIADSSVKAVIFDAGRGDGSELDARRACLHAVMTYADDLGATRVVFEQDDSLLRWDTSLVAAVEEETPEAEVQFSDDLAGRLGFAFAADVVPRGRDVGVSACVEHPGWVAVPLAWAVGGRCPALSGEDHSNAHRHRASASVRGATWAMAGRAAARTSNGATSIDSRPQSVWSGSASGSDSLMTSSSAGGSLSRPSARTKARLTDRPSSDTGSCAATGARD